VRVWESEKQIINIFQHHFGFISFSTVDWRVAWCST